MVVVATALVTEARSNRVALRSAIRRLWLVGESAKGPECDETINLCTIAIEAAGNARCAIVSRRIENADEKVLS